MANISLRWQPTQQTACARRGAPAFNNNPAWTPKDAPPAQRRWQINIYIMPNDPDMLLRRVAGDLPDAFKLQENRVPESSPDEK